MNFGSLFAGIGGFDLGFEHAGMTPTWQVEIDDKCQNVLAHHWPKVKRFEDVKKVGKRNLRPVDLICGGFPCQDLSVAGKRKGLAGERSGLWYEFLRILEELEPRWVVIENVPGLLSSNGGRDFAIIVSGLAKLRYDVCWRVLDAQYFGVAQRRRRVFIVGHLRSGCAAQVLFECNGSTWGSPPSRKEGARVAPSVKASSPSRRNGGSWPIVEEFVISGALSANYSKQDGSLFEMDNGPLPIAYPITTREGQHHDPTSDTLIAFDWQNGSKSERTRIVRSGEYAQITKTHVDAIAFQPRYYTCPGKSGGKPSSIVNLTAQTGDSAPCITFDWQSGGSVRRLTPTECERLQGFPDHWTLVNGTSDTARYKQLGNAVNVKVSEWIGKRIVKCS